ncbi:polysaccharide biosynthesis protein [Roseiflexus castenholzii]|jgi:FlaA1/EpsC-like NDP-sugar epimerase|uniref:Polysaccharide biosynthesis protein CapD n=1 Tax=Roseiflexus castenholzii (strain DSM 13941 / HLO8) TaxID=383372 RepID=A7NIZ8_ROSCS|nr:nucleoside-diphosphate sugar epimerase/dehydratase [Roseiflexus castenholzii]ABU57456.1 polysaccharide biosynthesis protein CapD [Roseiflexus castenholzii DSM 13941]
MMQRLKNRHFLIFDVLLVPLAIYVSFVLRLETFDLKTYWVACAHFCLMAVIVTPLIFRAFGVYRRYWRYASFEEVLLLCSATSLAMGATAILLTLLDIVTPVIATVPRSIPFIVPPIAASLVSIPRLLVRIGAARERRRRATDRPAPVLIMGAGDAASIIVREIQRNPRLGMEVVGLLDDDPTKRGLRLHGVEVLGDRHAIPSLVAQHKVRQVIIAMPGAPGKAVRDIMHICESVGVAVRIVPGMHELIDGTISVSKLRTIQIEDLLRRAPVQTDTAAVRGLVAGRRVLVTGGGGSIGSELCRQLLRFGPSHLIVLGHGENSVFEICNELDCLAEAHLDQSPCIVPVIADIRDLERLRSVFAIHAPELVFHAAAHKHVPLMEAHPVEAISNNVVGTRNLLDVALETGVERFVMISSDKAVNPTSVMGATKRIAEMLVLDAARRSGRPFVAVRFGNVLGSRGSVVLTFKRQIAAGGPVTVTHPEMRRYFMTIPEAVQLVLQASVLGRTGEIFMLDMGEPVKVVDLARDMIRLSGLEVGRDIDICFTGMRPGEKLFEELFARGEEYQPTAHSKIFIAAGASNNIPLALRTDVTSLERTACTGNNAAIRRLLRDIVPEYCPPEFLPPVPVNDRTTQPVRIRPLQPA